MTPSLLVFLRRPVPGRVKTRLAATLGPAAATAVYRDCVEHIAAELAAVGPGVRRYAFVADKDDADPVAAWLGGDWRVRPQAEGGLTERLIAAFHTVFAEGATAAVVTASDTPDLDRTVAAEALAALDPHDAVLGPALDGGYYLLGLRRPVPAVFEGIAWSTAAVADQTRARLDAAGLTWTELRPLDDVDTERQLRDWIDGHPGHPLAATWRRLLG